MRRKFLSVVLCVCMMLTMAPFAFAEGTESSSGSGSGSPTFNGLITTANALQNAINTATDNTTITVSGTIEISAPIDIDDTITITGTNNAEIKASSEFSGGYLIGLKTADKTLTLGNIKLNANEKSRVVYCNAGKVVVNGATITGGKTASSYIGGVYMTSNSEFEMNSGSITGNSVSSSYANDGYLQYSADLWIGANANGVLPEINGGTIGNVFVNANEYSATNPGGFTMNNGTITNLYVEYGGSNDKKYGASFTYNGGTIDNLYIATKEGDTKKVKIDNPIAGMTYKGGQTDAAALTPVAKVDAKKFTSLADAIATADNKTVILLKDVTEDVVIPSDKTVTLNLNGKKLTNVSSNTITNNGTLTITGTGTVDNVTHQKAALYNKGTATLEGGTFDRTKENGKTKEQSGNNSWYTIKNVGTMTVKDGVTVQTAGNKNSLGKFSSLVSNGYFNNSDFTNNKGIDNPKLTIEGGNFLGGLNTIKNDDRATLTIKNGTFSNYYQAVVQNHNVAEIKGGTFTAASDADSETYGVYNCGCAAETDLGTLTISGGTFTGATYAIVDVSKQSPTVSISGGNFAATKASIAKSTTSPATISITGGYFTSDPTAYVTTGYTAVETTEPGYNYKVVEASNLKADVAPAAPTVSIPDSFDNNQKAAAETVSDTLKASSDTVTGGGLNAAANAVANNNSVNQAEATNALGEKGITPTQGQSVRVVVQTYMNINIKDVNTANTDKKTLTLDITPMYRTVATTAAKDETIVLADTTTTGANAVTIGAPGKLTINKPVTIKLPLPAGFVSPKKDGSYDNIYVQHKGHEYIAVVTAQQTSAQDATTPSQTLFATFTNPDGFSTFTISSTSTAVAKIGDNRYTTLQDAVDAVKDNETIDIVGTGNTLSATVSGNKTFTVNANSNTVNLTAASGYNLTKDGDKYTVSRQHSSSSGSTSTTYNVNVNAATNGAVAADKKTASKGTTVTVTASPSKGYVVDAVKVVDKDGKDVAVTEKDGKYVFTMPASAVTVTGSFKAETPAPVALPFTDVKSGNWFYDAVKYAYAQGLMTGTSATTFAPNGTMNRAMIVTVLYRLEKSPAVTGASKFTDVPAGQWYSDAVAWAAANKIVNGYDETTFGPMNAVTREQMAAILFRYEQVKGLENVTLEENLNRFPDQNKISAYAIPALQWAVGQKIINGNADGTLDPTGTATRAQVAQIFTNLLNK